MKPTSVQTWKGKYLAEISRKWKAGEMSDLSIKSLCVKKHGRPCRRGTPSPSTPLKMTTLLTRVLARIRRRRIIRAREHTKIRIRKFYSKGLTAIYTKICTVQNFPLYGKLYIYKDTHKLYIYKDTHKLYIYKDTHILYIHKDTHILYVHKDTHILYIHKDTHILYIHKDTHILYVHKDTHILYIHKDTHMLYVHTIATLHTYTQPTSLGCSSSIIFLPSDFIFG